MSGMFQRIARRHADQSDEPAATETAGDGGSAAEATPAPDAAAPQADAPTERLPAVESDAAETPATVVDQPAQPPADAPTAPETAPAKAAPAPAAEETPPPRRAGFRARGRMRRRLRYLRRLRELQVRDLGGLMFDLRRFERKRDDLVAQKIDHIRACDDELHALERALDERRELRDVREPGIGGTCPRCFAVFGSADRFCASCGAALGGAVQGPAQVPAAPPAPPEAPGPQQAGPQQ
jgi:hypothetical protein